MAKDQSVRESFGHRRSVSPIDEQGGDRVTKDRSRESSASDRALREKDTEKLVYTLRNSDKTVELFSDNLKCLSPNKYLNDEVVQVYIAYLINEKCDYSNRKRIHVFDSYFHKAIFDTFETKFKKENKKEDQLEPINRASWRRLSKWLNGIDIFEKHFLVFPICHDQHWSAIIVCYPSEVHDKDEEPVSPDQSSDSRNKPVPGIMVLDSLGLKNSLQSKEVRMFLDFEWRSRCTVTKDFYYHNLKEYNPKLPKQTNSFDCGIFMLAYLRAFMLQPDKFYSYVRRNRDPEQERLTMMVNMELSHCSRESIKDTIFKKCKSERPRTK